jgi:hypothetical protein
LNSNSHSLEIESNGGKSHIQDFIPESVTGFIRVGLLLYWVTGSDLAADWASKADWATVADLLVATVGQVLGGERKAGQAGFKENWVSAQDQIEKEKPFQFSKSFIICNFVWIQNKIKLRMTPIRETKYKSTHQHNKICHCMNASNIIIYFND